MPLLRVRACGGSVGLLVAALLLVACGDDPRTRGAMVSEAIAGSTTTSAVVTADDIPVAHTPDGGLDRGHAGAGAGDLHRAAGRGRPGPGRALGGRRGRGRGGRRGGPPGDRGRPAHRAVRGPAGGDRQRHHPRHAGRRHRGERRPRRGRVRLHDADHRGRHLRGRCARPPSGRAAPGDHPRAATATSWSGTTSASPPGWIASATRPTPTPPPSPPSPPRSPHDRHRPPRRPDRRCRLLRRPGPVPAHGRAGPRPGAGRPQARAGRGADRRRGPRSRWSRAPGT